MGDQNSENKVVQEAIHLQCGLAPQSLWNVKKKYRKKFVHFTASTFVIQTSIFSFQVSILIHPLECVLSTYWTQGAVEGIEND